MVLIASQHPVYHFHVFISVFSCLLSGMRVHGAGISVYLSHCCDTGVEKCSAHSRTNLCEKAHPDVELTELFTNKWLRKDRNLCDLPQKTEMRWGPDGASLAVWLRELLIARQWGWVLRGGMVIEGSWRYSEGKTQKQKAKSPSSCLLIWNIHELEVLG